MGDRKWRAPSGCLLLLREAKGREDFRDWEIKRERVKKSEWERGVLPSHGTDQTTAGWFHSSLASHSSHPPLYRKPPPSVSRSSLREEQRRLFLVYSLLNFYEFDFCLYKLQHTVLHTNAIICVDANLLMQMKCRLQLSLAVIWKHFFKISNITTEELK